MKNGERRKKEQSKKRKGAKLGFIVGLLLFSLITVSLLPLISADTEPNDSISEADSIYSGDTVTGYLNYQTDEDDYYKIYLNAGETLSASMTGEGDDFDIYLYDASYDEVASSDNLGSDERITYTASYSGEYYIDCWAYSGSGSYTLSVSVSESGSDDGGTGEITPTGDTYTVYEAYSDDYVDISVTGAYSGYSSYFDFSNGDGVFFGSCMQMIVTSRSTKTLYLTLDSGRLFTPDDYELQTMVVTETRHITLLSESTETVNFYAMCTEMHDYAPSSEDSYEIGSMASGYLKEVVDTISFEGEQDAAGQCAIWAVTDYAEENDLKEYGASDYDLDRAQSILDNSGVPYKIKEESSVSSAGFGIMPAGFFYVALLLISYIVIEVVMVVWTYKDANKRGKNGALWALIVFLTGIIGLIVWFAIRPPIQQKPGQPPLAPPPYINPPANVDYPPDLENQQSSSYETGGGPYESSPNDIGPPPPPS